MTRLPLTRRHIFGLAALAAALAAGSLLATAALSSSGGAAAAATRWPSQSLRSLMGLETMPQGKAPQFALTDQHGRHVSLAALRGRVVVVEAIDPRCTDICPLVSREFVVAALARLAVNAGIELLHDVGMAGRAVHLANRFGMRIAGDVGVAGGASERTVDALGKFRGVHVDALTGR